MATFLIGYDIADATRLTRVYKKACHFACPIEKSVFLFRGSAKEVVKNVESLLKFINLKEDDIRCYELPAHGFKSCYGKNPLPLGVVWSGMSKD